MNRSHASHRRRWLRRTMALAAAVALALPALINPPVAQASQSVRAFTPRFSVTAQGALTIIGNTLETCPPGSTYNATTCAQAQAGTGTPAANNNNNNWNMAYVDVDGNGSTIDSSSATLSLPAGSTVLYAELTWAGCSNSAQRGVMSFGVPGGGYTAVSATRVDTLNAGGCNGTPTNYTAVADVTPLVAGLADPNGIYWGANVLSTTGTTDKYAAWALVVVYENLTLPLRNMVVFDGYAMVNGVAPTSISTTVSGFLTPASGVVDTKIGAIVYEGDIGYVNDSMQLNGVTLSNALNPANNFFNSSLTVEGVRFSTKNPDYVNQMAFDADIVDASGILANSSTSATITYASTNPGNYDTYYPTVVTFQTDVFTPVVEVTKSSQDLDHTDAIYNGDHIRYTLTATSTGNDPATFVVLSDPIPSGMTYVPGSAYILTGPNSDAVNPKTDALGDDQVDFTNNTVVFRLGVGANATMGGQMASGVSSTVQFDATVDDLPAGTHLVNQAYISYSGLTLGGGFASSSDSSTVSAGDNPDNQVTDAPPVGVADTFVVQQNTQTALSVLANDYDPDGNIDPSTVTIMAAPTHGTVVSIDPATGAVNYNPTPGYLGTDSFTYQVCDTAAHCTAETTASIWVQTTPWTPPTVRPDGANTNEGTAVTVDVLANDSAGSSALVPSTTTVMAPANFGSTSVNTTNGRITYTPSGYFYGQDTFIYRVCDGNGMCGSALVTIDVLKVDHAPTANNDSATVVENSSATVSVLANDTDPENNINIASVTVQSAASHGTTGVNANGSITYTPTAGYIGTDSFTYRVCDTTSPAPLCSGNATVSIQVDQAPPAGFDDAYTAHKNTALSVSAPGVLGNDSDPNGLTLHPVLGTGVSHGSLTLNADGSFTYTPTTGYTGPDSFTYQACTPGSVCSAEVTVSLDIVNDPPVATADSYSVAENGSLSVPAAGILANDSDPNGDTLYANLDTGVSHGSLSLNSNGGFTYTPTPGYYGADPFTYQACDSQGACSAATTVSISVGQLTPSAGDDSYSVAGNGTLTVPAAGVLANDTDPNGLTLHPVLAIGVSHGSLTLNADGSFTYVPTPGYSGPDSFTYQACTPAPGSICSADATVSLSVGNVPPVASDDSYSVAEDGSLSVPAPGVLGSDSDPNGDPLAATLVTGVSNGSLSLNSNGSFTYTPTAGYYGADSFTYQACDPSPACDTATVNIDVVQTAPVAGADSYTAHKNVTLAVPSTGVLANDTDPNGLTLHTVLGTSVSHGSLTLNADGSLTYTPTGGYTGADSFTYQACTPAPGSVCSAAATVSLDVVNDPPVATDDSYSVAENATLNVGPAGILANDSDPNGDAPSASLVTGVGHGSLSLNADGSFTYAPTAGYYGADSFTYQACDGQGACSADATVDIAVGQAAPTAAADSYATSKNAALPVPAAGVLANDTDPHALTLHAVLGTNVSHGSLTLMADGSFTYTPTAGYAGPDSFTYQACTPTPDSVCSSDATVSLDVVNDPPIATDDSYSVTEGGTLVLPPSGVLGNDSDPNGDALTASLVTGVSNGSLSFNSNGGFTYTPAGGYSGSDSFTYQACDPQAACDSATVSLTVDPLPPGAPTAVDDTAFEVPGLPVTISVLANDTANSGSLDLSSLQVVSGPLHGTATVQPAGTIVYSTPGGFASDTFRYSICNTVSPTCASANVDVTIDRPPAFGSGVSGSTISIVIGGPLPSPIPIGDPDSGDAIVLSVLSGTLPSGISLGTDGTWSGSTGSALAGNYPLTLHLCDTHGLCTDVSVVLGVSATADPSPSGNSTPPPTSLPDGPGSPENLIIFGLMALLCALAGAVAVGLTMERSRRPLPDESPYERD